MILKIVPYVYGKSGKREHCFAVIDLNNTSKIKAFGSRFFCQTVINNWWHGDVR